MTVFICNLSFDTDEDSLKEALVGCKVKEIKWGEEKDTGAFKGYVQLPPQRMPYFSIPSKLLIRHTYSSYTSLLDYFINIHLHSNVNIHPTFSQSFPTTCLGFVSDGFASNET